MFRHFLTLSHVTGHTSEKLAVNLYQPPFCCDADKGFDNIWAVGVLTARHMVCSCSFAQLILYLAPCIVLGL